MHPDPGSLALGVIVGMGLALVVGLIADHLDRPGPTEAEDDDDRDDDHDGSPMNHE